MTLAILRLVTLAFHDPSNSNTGETYSNNLNDLIALLNLSKCNNPRKCNNRNKYENNKAACDASRSLNNGKMCESNKVTCDSRQRVPAQRVFPLRYVHNLTRGAQY